MIFVQSLAVGLLLLVSFSFAPLANAFTVAVNCVAPRPPIHRGCGGCGRRSNNNNIKKLHSKQQSLLPLSTALASHGDADIDTQRSKLSYNNYNCNNDDDPALNLTEVDVLFGSRSSLVYDASLERYVPLSEQHHDGESSVGLNGFYGYSTTLKRNKRFLQRRVARFGARIRHAFLPEGVTPSYYRFIRWRILQRFINANVHVFGTQSLLLGLGLKQQNKTLGLAAALNWVLKDALGKVVRMAWASKMGRKFDSDAKRWRFRSSLLYALGNLLEIVTYICPGLFLLWATLANCFKQVSMLTSSSTRTALYNSFRDGTRENIGDITAKGEAQIAVVDLLGIASGVTLSRAVGMSVRSVLGVYLTLQITELACLYQEIRAVEFRVLNFERLVQCVNAFLASPQVYKENAALPTPQEMARKERIFFPPQHLTRRAIAFGSLGRAKLSPEELQQLLDMARNERFLLVVGEDIKNRRRRWWHALSRHSSTPEEHCHIVLHTDANNVDITKSTLALCFLRQALQQTHPAGGDQSLRSRDCMDLIYHAYQETDRYFPTFLKALAKYGWASPARFMFGRVTMRAEWTLRPRSSSHGRGGGNRIRNAEQDGANDTKNTSQDVES